MRQSYILIKKNNLLLQKQIDDSNSSSFYKQEVAYNRYFNYWKSRKNNEWHLSKEEFINKCTIDEDFKQKWFVDSVKKN
jgi:hypothetical protein